MPFEMFYHVNFQRVRGVCNDYLTTLGTSPFDAAFHLTSIGRAVEGAPRLGDEPVGADLPHLESAEPDPLNWCVRPSLPTHRKAPLFQVGLSYPRSCFQYIQDRSGNCSCGPSALANLGHPTIHQKLLNTQIRPVKRAFPSLAFSALTT